MTPQRSGSPDFEPLGHPIARRFASPYFSPTRPASRTCATTTIPRATSRKLSTAHYGRSFTTTAGSTRLVDYPYDALYRLTATTGREHARQSAFRLAPPDNDFRDYPFRRRIGVRRSAGLGTLYGNLLLRRRGKYPPRRAWLPRSNWTRSYAYEEASLRAAAQYSNRLSRTQTRIRQRHRRETYLYDAHGNIVQMAHLPLMRWDFLDHLAASSRQVVNCGTPETTYYVYDSSGARVRKVTESANGRRKSERLYVGGFELYSEFAADGDVVLERERCTSRTALNALRSWRR